MLSICISIVSKHKDTLSGRDFAAGKLQKVMKIFLHYSLFLISIHLETFSFFFTLYEIYYRTIYHERISPTILPFPTLILLTSPIAFTKFLYGTRKRRREGEKKGERNIDDFSNCRHAYTQESSWKGHVSLSSNHFLRSTRLALARARPCVGRRFRPSLSH